MEEEKTTLDEQSDNPLSKEEILKLSRSENKNGDELYKKNDSKALKCGIIFLLSFSVAIFIAELIISKKVVVTPAVCSVLWAIIGGTNLFNGIFNKKKSTILLGILGIITAILNFVIYIGCLLRFN